MNKFAAKWRIINARRKKAKAAAAKKPSARQKKIGTVRGQRFDQLEAIERGPDYFHQTKRETRERWWYECDCGKRILAQPSGVRSNARKGFCACSDCYKRASYEGRLPWQKAAVEDNRLTDVDDRPARA